jgi:hypothetical protein
MSPEYLRDDEGRHPNGSQLGRSVSNRGEFWSINLGHVLTICTLVCGGLSASAGLIYQFAQLRIDNGDVKQGISDLRTWRTQQDAENQAWHEQINQSFDTINRHLERLDWTVQQRATDVPPAPLVPAPVPFRRK